MIDMNGPCICPGDPDHTPHPTPCGAPNSGTGHGPWCGPCNTARLARISAGFAQIKAALAGSTPDRLARISAGFAQIKAALAGSTPDSGSTDG